MTLVACRPLGPVVTSNSTREPSSRERYPSVWIAEKCTKTSSPFSLWIKPQPLAALNHFTVPFSFICLYSFLTYSVLIRTEPARRPTTKKEAAEWTHAAPSRTLYEAENKIQMPYHYTTGANCVHRPHGDYIRVLPLPLSFSRPGSGSFSAGQERQ